jgi:hypothetical protein
MSITNATAQQRTGKPCELGRYNTNEGDRILVGQRVDGIVQITDRPLGRAGRSYLVEAGIASMGELAALVADYRAQAASLGDCPMRASLLDLRESSRPREALS